MIAAPVRRTVLLVGLCAALALAMAHMAGANGTDYVFHDSAGDCGTPPMSTADITSVDAGTSGNGDVRMDILFPKERASFAPDATLTIWLDTDRNPKTGLRGPNKGADFVITLRPHDRTYRVARASLGQVHLPSMHANSAEDQSWWANRRDLGNTTGFNFWIESRSGGSVDRAPNRQSWFFPLGASSPPPPPPSGTSPSARQKLSLKILPVRWPPRAGMQAKVQINVVVDHGLDEHGESATSEWPPDTLTCTATIGTTSVRTTVSGSFTKVCEVPVVPTNSTGKVLAFVFKVRFHGMTLAPKTLRTVIRA